MIKLENDGYVYSADRKKRCCKNVENNWISEALSANGNYVETLDIITEEDVSVYLRLTETDRLKAELWFLKNNMPRLVACYQENGKSVQHQCFGVLKSTDGENVILLSPDCLVTKEVPFENFIEATLYGQAVRAI